MSDTNLARAAIAITLALLTGCDLFASDASRIERAREHLEAREFRSAEIQLKNVLRADPENIEARVLLGTSLVRSGEPEAAVKELRRARELGAAADDFLLPLARAMFLSGSYNEVVNLDVSEVESDETRAAVLAVLGRGEVELDNLGAGTRQFERALELVPGQPDAIIGLARVDVRRGNPDAAAERLAQLVEDNPENPEAWGAYAEVQFSRQDYAASQRAFQRAHDLMPELRRRERLLYLSGVVENQLARNDVEGGKATVAQMLAITESHPISLMQAARVDLATGNVDSARARAEQVVAQAPEYEPGRMLLATAALAAGNRVLAATQLQAILNANPGNEQARKLLARVHMDLGSADEALEVLQPLLAGDRADSEVLTMAGTASLRAGRAETGVSLLEQSAEAATDDPRAAMQSANALLAAGQIDRAIDVLERLPESEQTGQRELMLLLAKLQAGDVEGAEAQVQAALAKNPDDHNAHRLSARFHLSQQDFAGARAAFDKVLELRPGDAEAILGLSRLDVTAGDAAGARQRLEQALEANPGDLTLLTSLAELAEREGATARSLALIEQARKANPKSAEPALRLARHYLGQGKLERAAQYSAEAVRKAPNSAEPHLVHGIVLLQDGRPTEAQASFERAVQVAPNSVNAHMMLAAVQKQLGLADASLASYQRAAALDPKQLAPQLAVAASQIERGNLDEAERLVTNLVAAHPERSETLELAGDVAAQKKDFARALDHYSKAAAIGATRALAAKQSDMRRRLGYDNPVAPLEQWRRAHPEDIDALRLLGNHYIADQQFDQAVASYEQLMEAQPDAGIAVSIAAAHELAGRLDEAVRWLERARELDPANNRAAEALASLELRRGDAERVEALARELRTREPGDARYHELEGLAQMARGDYQAAAQSFSRAMEIEPTQGLVTRLYDARRRVGDPEAWRLLERWAADHPEDHQVTMRLAAYYEEQDLDDEAIETYRRVLYDQPDNFIALNNLAWVYFKRSDSGDLKRALNAAEQAHEQNPRVPAVLDTYGWLLLHDGDVDKAIELLAQAASSAPDNPEIGYHYAVALHRAGDMAGARTQLDRVLASDAQFDGRDDAEALRRDL